MKAPYSWIKELVDISISPEELADRLSLCGAEADAKPFLEGNFDNVVIGSVVELEPIENSDHLRKAIVDDGHEKFQVVCGAPNVAKGQKIILAKIGAELKGGFKIKQAKLRGIESFGMICSETELGISDDHSGIMVLDDDASLGENPIEYLKLNDTILHLDLTPNRPDLLSLIGVARDISCLFDTKIIRPQFEVKESAETADEYIKVSIDDPDACPRYAARVIKNIKIGPSPWWIKRKLLLSGVRPISNIVDITNLVMLEMGHPLHAFDYDFLGSKEIVVRRALNKEKFTTLDNKEHELTPDVLLITNGEKAVAAAGVMGGLNSEVQATTSTVLLEAAYFNPVTIRKSKNILGINSESSHRFERGADPNIVCQVLDRAASLMAEYAGSEILSGIVDCYPNTIEPAKLTLRPERVNALMGTNISKERMIKILEGIEFGVKDKGTLEVVVPTFTADVTREVDLIEEIIRIEGFNSVPESIHNSGPLFTPRHADDNFYDSSRNVMTSLGFDEMYSPGMADAKLLSKVSGDEPQLKVLNPIADDLTVMHNSLFYSLLKAVSHNISHRNVNLQLFDMGRIYLPGNPPYEEEKIGLTVTGKADDHWYNKGRIFDFYDLKGAVDSFLRLSHILPIDYIPTKHFSLDDSCSFELQLNNKTIGYAGQIKQKIAKQFDVKQNVFAAMLDFRLLLESIQPESIFKSLPRFPAAPRDLAVIVDETVEVGSLMDEISQSGGLLLEKVELFDLFTGTQVGYGKKSIAFSMIYRSWEKSLESDEISKIHKNIADNLNKKFKAQIREA